MKKLLPLLLMMLLSVWVLPRHTAAQSDDKPLILPVAVSPGPGTWLLGQLYGNTTSAFNFGQDWYEAGQGLHFGMDFSMPCGTPLVAVADGEVVAVDSGSFGAGPHNLILRHPQLNISTLYGHLLERPNLISGQPVAQGDFVALSGDPDAVCDSRPHLHFEVRSYDFQIAYNPVDYIEANWHGLMSIGPFSNPMFQQDMDNARRWMSVDDQPAVVFGGVRLNDYNRAWPYPLDVRPPVNPQLMRQFEPLPETVAVSMRQIGFGACCAQPWWHPTDANRFYLVDGAAGERASVFEYTVDSSVAPLIAYEAPPRLLSPDANYQITRVNGQITVRQLSDLSEWTINTQGALPAISTDNSRLMWEIWRGSYLPGEVAQTVEVWVADDLLGTNTRRVWSQPGGYAVWLDETRLLIVTPVVDRTDTTLTVFDTRDDSSYTLGTWNWLRGLSIAPGGGRLMFYTVWGENPADNAIYTIETQPGAAAEKLPFFGGWQWRDADSVYYLPYDPVSPSQILAYYHIPTRTDRYLTDPLQMPFTIANSDWEVAPDGNTIIFLNARDMNLWLMEVGG